MKIKVVDFIEMLKKIEYDKDTELIFGLYGGEEFYPLKPDGIEEGDFVIKEDYKYNKGNKIYVSFGVPKECIKAEVEYKMYGFEDDIIEAFNHIFANHFLSD